MNTLSQSAAILLASVTLFSCGNTEQAVAKQQSPPPPFQVATLAPKSITEYKKYPTTIPWILK